MLSNNFLATTADIWDYGKLVYDANAKADAHKRAKRLLRHFARSVLRLAPNTYSVRSNLAGIASSGEVTLHTDPLRGAADTLAPQGVYVQISQSHRTVLYRACTNQADYVGFTNKWLTMDACFGCEQAMIRFANELVQLANDTHQVRYPSLV